MQTPPPADQRIALVIGNSNYQTAPKLANPGNDAQSMSQLLNSAGFEVTQATDLTRSDMVRVVQDFSAKVAERGPSTVAMIYYAGHGVQVAGENYLLPVDAKISSPSDLDGNSLRLVDLMGTLESIQSRMRIVVLDACRNNPFPEVNDTGRGLAIVDAPNGSIVGYSTAPGMEAQDGDGNHSPYTSAFLNFAREPNLPIEQLFKRVRLEVNNATKGRQTPWESSSLTSDFYFFGDTAVAASRAPDRRPIVQIAANLPSRSVRQAYDYVLSEGSPEYYEEFIRLYPHDPLCDHIRVLLGNLRGGKGVAQGGARELALRLQDVPRQLFQQPLRHGCIEAAGCAEGRAADAVHASGEAVAVVQAGEFRQQPDAGHLQGQFWRPDSHALVFEDRYAARQGWDQPDQRRQEQRQSQSTPARSRDCPADSTTIRRGSPTGTWSTPRRVVSTVVWAEASANASPQARPAVHSPAVRSVAAVHLAAVSGGADRRASHNAKPGRAHALPGFV